MWLYLPFCTIALAVGIAAHPLIPFQSEPFLLYAAIVAMVGCILLQSRPPLFLLSSMVLFLVVGGLRAQTAAGVAAPLIPEGEFLLDVDVTAACRPARPNCSMTARVTRIYQDGRWAHHDFDTRLVFRSANLLPLVGDRLLVRAKLGRYERGLHEYAFDAQRWAATKGVDAIAIVDEPAVVFHEARLSGDFSSRDTWSTAALNLAHRASTFFFRSVDRGRIAFERVIISTLGETGEAGVLLAMTTGTKSLLSDSFRRDFAAAGIAHVLAVSGMHLGLISMVFYAGLWRLIALIEPVAKRIPAQQLASGVTIAFIGCYVVFTGFPVSAARAGLMAFFVLGPRLMGKPSSGLHSLTTAVMVMLLLNPRWISDLGFQLSVCATLSLILLKMPRALAVEGSRTLRALAWLFEACRGSIIISTVTAIATFPSLLWAFGTIPASSQLGNLLLVPPLALVALPATIIGVGLALCGLPNLGILELASHIVTLSGQWIELWRPWFCAELYWGRPSTVGMFAWSALAAASPWIFRLHPIRLAALLGVLALPLLVDLPPTLLPSGDLEIHAIPVGQGDATLVAFPEGTTMLIDAGGSGFGENRTGLSLVLPYIRALGYGRVDIVVNSHGDADHIGGLLPLIPFIKPSQIYVGEPDPSKALEAFLYKTSLDHHAEYLQPHNETRRIQIDGVPVDVLPGGEGFGSNDSGLVLRACYDEICALFVGDIEEPRERYLIEQRTPLRAQYLKVGHHGSKTSTSQPFLDRVGPSVAVIQLGYENRFGFPHEPVMERFRSRSIPTERTDHGEAIVHATDGERLWKIPHRQRATRNTPIEALRRLSTSLRGLRRLLFE